MNWLFDALFHAVFLWIPLWLYVVAAIVGLLLVFRVFGWQATLAAAVGAIIFLATAFGAQRGRDAQIAKDLKDADKAIDRAKAARKKAGEAPPEKLRDTDGFRRD